MDFSAFNIESRKSTKTATAKLLKPGEYNFQVLDATNEISKKGNEMIKLKLRVWDDYGNSGTVYDYLVCTPNAIFKIQSFSKSAGIEDIFNTGKLTNVDCFDKKGKLAIDIQHDENGQYSDKNNVKKYIYSKLKIVKNKNDDFKDDQDIPF